MKKQVITNQSDYITCNSWNLTKKDKRKKFILATAKERRELFWKYFAIFGSSRFADDGGCDGKDTSKK